MTEHDLPAENVAIYLGSASGLNREGNMIEIHSSTLHRSK